MSSLNTQSYEALWPKIKENLAPIELKRRKAVSWTFITFLLLYPIYTLLLLFYIFYSNINPDTTLYNLFALFFFFSAIGIFALWKTKLEDFRKTFREQFLPSLVKTILPDFNYQANKGFSKEQYHQTNLFPRELSEYKSSDFFSGQVQGVKLQFAQVATYFERQGLSTKNKVPIFVGLLLELEANKSFQQGAVVLPDYNEARWGRFALWLQARDKAREARQGPIVYMENPEFERAFIVRGQDPIETRYLITPDMMIRFLELKNLKPLDFMCSFVPGHVYLALPLGRDLFTPSLFRSLYDAKQVQEIYQTLTDCLKVVEILNLNTRIWTKS